MEVSRIYAKDTKFICVVCNPTLELKFTDFTFKGRMTLEADELQQMEEHTFTFRYRMQTWAAHDIEFYELHTTDYNLPIIDTYLAKYDLSGVDYTVRCSHQTMHPNFQDELGLHYNIPIKFVVVIADKTGRLKKIFNIGKD